MRIAFSAPDGSARIASWWLRIVNVFGSASSSGAIACCQVVSASAEARLRPGVLLHGATGAMRTLSTEQARSFYDRLGARQDTQAFYEDRATSRLVAHAAFGEARFVVELGCGTGRFAERLLANLLPPDARYIGIDLSRTMADLAKRRLSRFGDRVEVHLTGGPVRFDLPDASADRFVSNFVLDLLSESQIHEAFDEAHRLLRPGGRLCLASLGRGNTPVSRLVERVWTTIHGWSPILVGGCRPLVLGDFLDPQRWHVLHHETIAPWGLPTEVLIASSTAPSAST